MPESNDRISSNSIRRALDEGSRRVPEPVRQLPGHAVRAAVIGIGKLLRATETVRTGYGEVRRNGVAPTADRLRRDGLAALRPGLPPQPSPHTPEPHERAAAEHAPERPTTPAAEPPAEAATEAAAAQAAGPATETAAETAAETATEVGEAPAGPTGAAGEPGPATSEVTPPPEELPVSNYDEATLGSLRARLRNLTASDLRTLLAYERAHYNRANVVTMFENRISKLEGRQER